MIETSLIEAVNHPYSGFITLALVVAFALWANRVVQLLHDILENTGSSVFGINDLNRKAEDHMRESFHRWRDLKGSLNGISLDLSSVKSNTRKEDPPSDFPYSIFDDDDD
tara:strand:+ start:305 stop:634 length:330 start_codon:yes stop_codon:yes gene_type:complete